MMLAATSLAALFAAATAEVVPNVGYVNGWAISEMAVRDDDRVRLSSRIRLNSVGARRNERSPHAR